METYEIRVCQCCVLTHANGECCAEGHGEATFIGNLLGNPDLPIYEHSDPIPVRHEHEPLSLTSSFDGLAMGGEHTDVCGLADEGECGCGDLGFSWSACEGCGSPLGGDRFQLTVFVGERA